MEDAQALVPPVLNGAGFWIRAAARVIDTIFGFVLGFVVGIICGIALVMLSKTGIVSPGWQDRIRGLHIVPFLFSAIGNLGYHTMMEGLYGASVGKLVCQLRVLREDGTPIGFSGAIVRSLAYYVDALFFGLIGYSKMRESDLNQRFGDHWAHTVVVRTADVPDSSRQGSLYLILGLFVGSALWAACAAAGLMIQAF